MMLRIVTLVLVTALLAYGLQAGAVQPIAPPYPEALPGPFTGGFGEDTCHSCHFDYPLNTEEAGLAVEGIPEQYEAGATYPITLTVTRTQLQQAGFQLSSRYGDGSQAGTFAYHSSRISETETRRTIQYLQHSAAGSQPSSPDSAQWSLKWQAPDRPSGTIHFHIAANAANGDASAFGDFILVQSLTSRGPAD